ncbi:MAG: GcrA family cell cycle regulator [Pseudomonadota bacterium]
MVTTQWSEDRVKILKEMWKTGYSARQISQKLGGVTRNAVIGKANRLGLSQRPRAIRRIPIAPPTSHESSCQWPIGNPGEPGFHLCLKRALPGKPYCQAHCNIAYRSLAASGE